MRPWVAVWFTPLSLDVSIHGDCTLPPVFGGFTLPFGIDVSNTPFLVDTFSPPLSVAQDLQALVLETKSAKSLGRRVWENRCKGNGRWHSFFHERHERPSLVGQNLSVGVRWNFLVQIHGSTGDMAACSCSQSLGVHKCQSGVNNQQPSVQQDTDCDET